jgi:hypothetical protein
MERSIPELLCCSPVWPVSLVLVDSAGNTKLGATRLLTERLTHRLVAPGLLNTSYYFDTPHVVVQQVRSHHKIRDVPAFAWQALLLAATQCLYVVKIGAMIDPYPDMAVFWLLLLGLSTLLPFHLIPATANPTMRKREVSWMLLLVYACRKSQLTRPFWPSQPGSVVCRRNRRSNMARA